MKLTIGKKVICKRVTAPFLHKHGVNEVLMIFRNVDNYSLSKIHSFSGNSFYAASQVFTSFIRLLGLQLKDHLTLSNYIVVAKAPKRKLDYRISRFKVHDLN